VQYTKTKLVRGAILALGTKLSILCQEERRLDKEVVRGWQVERERKYLVFILGSASARHLDRRPRPDACALHSISCPPRGAMSPERPEEKGRGAYDSKEPATTLYGCPICTGRTHRYDAAEGGEERCNTRSF
jgi:hypothetical protein